MVDYYGLMPVMYPVRIVQTKSRNEIIPLAYNNAPTTFVTKGQRNFYSESLVPGFIVSSFQIEMKKNIQNGEKNFFWSDG